MPTMELADFVFVGIDPPAGLRRTHRIASSDAVSDGPPWSTAQPRQLWLIDGTLWDATAVERSTLTALGASVARIDADTDVWEAVAGHALALLDDHRDSRVELSREVVTLRRELNRALSALSDRHPILGLLPSPTLDEVLAARRFDWSAVVNDTPATVAPFVPDAAFSRADVEALEAEVQRLQDAISALHSTKIMRFSALPRRLYGRLRSR